MGIFSHLSTRPPEPPLRMLIVFEVDKSSRIDPRHAGFIVEYDGGAIEGWFKEAGLDYEDVGGVDGEPKQPGPFVWEGRVYEYEDEPDFKGTFRRLTAEEGARFLAGEPVFDTHRRLEP